MSFLNIKREASSNGLKVIAWLLLACTFATVLSVPTVNAAEAPCPATGVNPIADIGTEQVQLKGCTFDFSDNNGDDSSTFTAPSGLAVGDLLMVHISTDRDNEALNPPVGWTQVAAILGDEDISSNVWTRVVTDLGVDVPGVTTYTFTWTNEKNFGYLLHYTGASGLFNLNAVIETSAESPPTSPAIVPNSPDNLILRMSTIDRRKYVDDAGPNFPNYNNIIQRRNNTNNGGNTRIAVSAAYGHDNGATSLGPLDFNPTSADGSHNRTFSIEPYEFRFSTEDGVVGTSSVCGIEQITLSVTDRNGGLMSWFEGSVTLSTSSSNNTGALWSYAGVGLTAGVNGNATYQFQPGDGGTVTLNYYNPNLDAGTIGFNVTYGNFSESTNPSYTPATLTILDCEFVVSYPSDLIDREVESCGSEYVRVTLQDTDGNAATNYTGTVTISAAVGNYEQFFLGTIVPDNLTADDGVATYDLAVTPSSGTATADLVFYHGDLSTADISFTFTESTSFGFEGDAGNLPLSVLQCEVIVELTDGDLTRDVCTFTRVTFTVLAGGTTYTDYLGDIEIATSAGQGLWYENVASGSLVGDELGNGTETYSFGAGDPGSVILDFRNQVAVDDLSFSATGLTAYGFSFPEGASPSNEIDIVQCTLTITTSLNETNVCSPAVSVTYTLAGPDGPGAGGYAGEVNLQTSSGKGNYVKTSGANTLQNPSGDNGAATYEFAAADGGVLVVDYSVTDVPAGGTATLTAIMAGVTVDSSGSSVEYHPCEFRITFPDDAFGLPLYHTDVCSVISVQIEVIGDPNGTPATVTDFTGEINLTTSTGIGSWSEDLGDNDGTLSGSGNNNGAASYVFDDADNGLVFLNFTHTAQSANSLNINVSDTDTVSSDPGIPGSDYDPILQVELCTLQISFDGGGVLSAHDDVSITACEVQAVTIEIFDRNGDPADAYEGQINISTSTDNGNWADTLVTNNGALSNAVVDGGAVSYTFDDLDDGVVTLDYSNTNPETVNINIVDEVIVEGLILDGVIIEEPAADPNIQIGSCIPTVAASVCAAGGSGFGADLTIGDENSDPLQQSRMVLIATSHEGNATVTGVSFAGTAFTTLASDAQLLRAIQIDEGDFDSNTTLWAMKDIAMPGTAGDYPFTVTHGDNNVAACAFYLTDVEQLFPTEVASPNEEDGQLNATGSAANGNPLVTTVTTTQNNALILSIASSGLTGTFNQVSPSPPLSRLTQGPNPENGVFATSSGNSATAAPITITETASNAPNRHSHIVAAFNPFITGPPVAEGYEPVLLFKTYSGNISYRAIGASFQDSPNGGGVCDITKTSISANLDLPDAELAGSPVSGPDFKDLVPGFDSNIVEAYLYWFASASYDAPLISGTETIESPPGSGLFGVTNVNAATTANFGTVTFEAQNGDGMGGTTTTNLIADDVFAIENVGSFSNGDFYVAYRDVTDLMVGPGLNSNGDYSISNLVIDQGEPWLSRGSCAGGFALVVVYDNPYEQLRVINLFHGFQPFQNSSFTLVPRNFRMAESDPLSRRPNGQVTHITVEGDAGLSGAGEGLTLQETPNDLDPADFNALINDYNPEEEEFNSSITRPIYSLQDPDPAGTGVREEYFYLFDQTVLGGGDSTAGNPSDGYEIDFPNPAVFTGAAYDPPDASGTETQYGISYGVDVDTHYIEGDTDDAFDSDGVTDYLFEFADPLAVTPPAEEITTRYSADQDLVLLVAEVISVTNADLADIEVTISEADFPYKVNSVGVYNIEVKNNGSGASVYGTANGEIELVGELPAGMTFGVGAVAGTGWTCANTTTAFTCTIDLFGSPLGATPLELVVATVTIDGPDTVPPSFFESLENNAKLIVRVAHSDGSCAATPIGELPIPTAACRSPEFDNVNDLQGGALDINDLENKTAENNNVHSITTVVRGKETDLSVVKGVVTVLQEGALGVDLYTITVTNNDTVGINTDDIDSSFVQPTITVTDDEPVGVNFISASSSTPGWACSVDEIANPDKLTCNFTGDLAVGDSSVITIVGDVTGSSPTNVKNIALVETGLYNFDSVPGNTSEDNTPITAEPTVVTDRFLLSVSAVGNVSLGTVPGLLADFNENDIILYEPQFDSAVQFIDSLTTAGYSVNDPNAVHLLPNGQVVLSASGVANSIGVNGTGTTAQAFGKEDIVLYDKLRNSASLLFDGSALIASGALTAVDFDIDSVYVLPDGTNRIIFSSAASASGNKTGGGTESWSDSDLVMYDPADDTFLVYLEADNVNVFNNIDAQVDAAYLRIDPATFTTVEDTFVLSSAVPAILGNNSVAVGLDDVAEITIDTGTPAAPLTTTATNLFNGNTPLGIFDTTDPNLRLNALHLIEPAHLGHFEIAEVTPGNACAPVRIRISKHVGTSETTDTSYTGFIRITTDSMPANGIWAVDTGTPANLINNYTTPPGADDADNGEALYEFTLADGGEVILTLDVSQSPPVTDSVNVSVTNGFVVDEDNDGPFQFNLVSTDVDYRDDFEIADIDNSDGSAGWSNDWVEVDTAGPSNMSTGNIQIAGGKLRLAYGGGGANPSMTRTAGLGNFAYAEPVAIEFDYGWENIVNANSEIQLQISNDGSAFTTVKTYDSLTGSSVSGVSDTVDISAFITNDSGAEPLLIAIDGTDTDLYVRLVVVDGYTVGTFTVDNFRVTTSTNACSVNSVVHYHIDVSENGLACVASNVTITGHDFGHNVVPIPANTILSLTTSNNAGSWVNAIGAGLSSTPLAKNGAATVTVGGADVASIGLSFNYTDPGTNGAAVNIDVSDGALTEVRTIFPDVDAFNHDPTPSFSEAGLVFYDQDSGNLSTTLPFQIAGKPSLTAPASGNITLQIVRTTLPVTDENAAAACTSLVGPGETVKIKLIGQCIDPDGCAVTNMSVLDSVNGWDNAVPVTGAATLNPETGGKEINLLFQEWGDLIGSEPVPRRNIGAQLNFIYPDAGKIALHGEYEIRFNDDSSEITGVASGDTINGASENFIVRPFGFDIDFGDAGNDRSSAAGALSLATDATGPAFARAGVGFDATVSAVLWEDVDDAGPVDGIPDTLADLSNNTVATNFGKEAAVDNTVLVSVRTDNPGVPGGVTGVLVVAPDAPGATDVFDSFTNAGSAERQIAINEVGIFNLTAELVDGITRLPINYFESSPYTADEGVVGGVLNVGRIYPNNFELTASSFMPRVNQQTSCVMGSPFTYMSENFEVSFTLQAQNFKGDPTVNYFDDFAKLNAFDELDIRAIIDVDGGADIDLTEFQPDPMDPIVNRLVNSSLPATFATDEAVEWVNGDITLTGEMNIARLTTGEDAPLSDVRIAFSPRDNNLNDGDTDNSDETNDVLLSVFNIELDDGAPDVAPDVNEATNAFTRIGSGAHEFRYGRLLVDNTYGSEFEDLDIPIRIEYFDGADFVVNTADSCTALVQTFPTPDLDFVAGAYESVDVGNPFEAGDTLIENEVDATVTVFEGQTNRLADGNNDEDDDTDRPFFTTAPDTEQAGRVLVEFDLDPGGLNAPTSLFFLKYDWRGGVGQDLADEYDEVPEGANYTDNPRGIVEFGSFRGHDRVINWQEIYIGPTP